MNREILFRGRCCDSGSWHEGMPVRASEPPYRICAIAIPEKRTCVQIDPETCGEYTGLTDKNGRRIFEGDILDLTPYMITDVGVVKFGEYKDLDMGNDYPCGHVGFYVNVEKQRISVRKDILFFVSECKVLGNIHDNPELLGGNGNEGSPS